MWLEGRRMRRGIGIAIIFTALTVGAAVVASISCGPAIIIVVLVLMLIYEEFESRVIIPRIYGHALRLPSSVILFSLLVGSV